MTRKANKISETKRLQIAKFKDKNPDYSYRMLADKYNVTENQARTACDKYKKGELGSANIRRSKKIKAQIDALTADGDPNSLLNEMLNEALIKLSADSNRTPENLLKLVRELAATVKQLTSIGLNEHIKSPDVRTVCKMARIIKPELTDKEIIEIWHKARARK